MTAQVSEIMFEVEKDTDFKITHIDGVLGTLNQNIGQIALFCEMPVYSMGKTVIGANPEVKVERIKRIILMDARMSPQVFKSITEWMTNQVKEYEKAVASGSKPVESQSYYQ
jgi:hypothetical protein